MSSNRNFLMVGSCVTTMNIDNVGSSVSNIDFVYLFSCCYDNKMLVLV
jgi:hypothetical protein